MDSIEPIVNRVAQSALVTLDLETFFPTDKEIAVIDLKDFLFKGLILREDGFRERIKNTDWTSYQNRYVAIHCSADAIIPMWAYMILSSALGPYAKDVAFCTPANATETFLLRNLAVIETGPFSEKRVLVKGCGDRKIPEAAYVQITERLAPVVRALMYGEACSTVPVYKKSSK